MLLTMPAPPPVTKAILSGKRVGQNTLCHYNGMAVVVGACTDLLNIERERAIANEDSLGVHILRVLSFHIGQ